MFDYILFLLGGADLLGNLIHSGNMEIVTILSGLMIEVMSLLYEERTKANQDHTSFMTTFFA